jgi:hypothetical protein
MVSSARRLQASAWIIAVSFAFAFAPVAGANALGSNSFWCGSPGSYYGSSWNDPNSSNDGAQTARQLRDCGTMGAQSLYRPYPGASILYSSWVYHSSNAIKSQSGTVGGRHYNGNTGTIGTT